MKFYDQMYGIFNYCSPSCRDNLLLPSYNKKLQEDLKKNPLHSDSGSTAGGNLSTTVLYSPPATSTGVAGTQAASTEPTALQCKYILYVYNIAI